VIRVVKTKQHAKNLSDSNDSLFLV